MNSSVPLFDGMFLIVFVLVILKKIKKNLFF